MTDLAEQRRGRRAWRFVAGAIRAWRPQLLPRPALKGNLGYLAPEQPRFEERDVRSDLFAFGTTLYELARRAARRCGADGCRDVAIQRRPLGGVHVGEPFGYEGRELDGSLAGEACRRSRPSGQAALRENVLRYWARTASAWVDGVILVC